VGSRGRYFSPNQVDKPNQVNQLNQVNKEIEMVSKSKEAQKNRAFSPMNFYRPCPPLLLYSGKLNFEVGAHGFFNSRLESFAPRASLNCTYCARAWLAG
jgi:hypothetical protein